MAAKASEGALAPPAVTALKEGASGHGSGRGFLMERTVSENIREQRDDLKKAAEQSMNAIMDLDLDGTIRWMSPSWHQLTNASPESVTGKPVCEIICNHKTIFADAIQLMRTDDSKSRIIRFAVFYHNPGDKSNVTMENAKDDPAERVDKPAEEQKDQTSDQSDEDSFPQQVGLEAQGIMVYDRTTGEESHTMWMIKPAIEREITIDLPPILVESLGIGAHVLAQYLTELADTRIKDPVNHPPPLPILCRICERQIIPWWFEKHTELCLQEHRAEMEIQLTHETLETHRAAIVKVLDALEAQAKRLRSKSQDCNSPPPLPEAEYKGQPIGPAQPTSNPSSGASSGRASPASSQSHSQSRTRETSSPAFGHIRARSFAVRRPLARIVELVLDLCDTALEITTPSVKENDGQLSSEIRTQSPQSESRVAQVQQWQSPSASTLETEQGLAMLCDDTSQFSKAKVEAVLRHKRILEYSERIRMEFDVLVQECIDAALDKASRIAAGEISDSSENSASDAEDELLESPLDLGGEISRQSSSQDKLQRKQIPTGPSSLAMAFRNASDPAVADFHSRRASSAAASTRSNSPMGAKTPRSMVGLTFPAAPQARGSTMFESDTGADSDTSVHSSFASASRRAESPAAELSLGRMASARGRKRTSLALPSLQNAIRQESPGHGAGPPLSPLRSLKPRLPSGEESNPSPITSPAAAGSEFSSPIIRAQNVHHRRQSSVALGGPASPRLTGISNNPQPKAPQTSIKDFEVIKPISKGAFGSVYLAKKKVTGDYYALKVLKKGDMVAKNQVTNVKAERAIMMWQGESDFVAKLYWTFASKDYLYLVMEYLNGGDCASLIKSLGGIPEDWAKKYLAEVVLGVQHLHSRQIVHRDLKPDNLLIDQKGHLKLTDFGLSRMGLVGRQKRIESGKSIEAPDLFKHGPFRRVPSVASSRSTSFDFNGNPLSPANTPSIMPSMSHELSQPSYFSLSREASREPSRKTSGNRSDSENSDALQAMFRSFSLGDGPGHHRSTPIEEDADEDGESPDPYILHPVASNTSHTNVGTPPHQSGMLPPPMALFDPEDNSRRFVGTPDYLAPETINGVGQDEMSDWWSLGCILFESLYGYPPFHAETPEEVFQNILARNIHWPDDEDCPVSDEAKDLMNKLMTVNPKERLGSNGNEQYADGGDEIRAHPWFADIEWETLRDDEASFIPNPVGVEDTEYFDARGATLQNFNAEFEDQASSPAETPGADYPDRPHDALSRVRMKVNSIKRGLIPLHIPPHVRDGRSRRLSEPVVPDDFGTFQFKNLPVLEKANKDVLSKLRAEAMQAQNKPGAGTNSPAVASPSPSLEASPIPAGPIKRALSANKGRPASPALLNQVNASPIRQSQPSSPLLVSFSAGQHHERRKTSSGSSNMSHSTSSSLQPGSFFDVPRFTAGGKAVSAASSPSKFAKGGSTASLQRSVDEAGMPQRKTSGASPRSRANTLGSQEGDLVPDISQQKRRSQVFDVSPSSSDTEEQRQRALLRVHRRRQSSRRLSQITLAEGPAFRPLDVLICEDHPVSRLVMERLLEKLRCRTISVQNGSEAVRYALSKVKFDIIMMEFKLPQINGADVARMVRETRNANSHTPIVAVTGYLKELQAPHDFDALIEKPPTSTKLQEVMGRLCQWKPPPPGWTPAQLSANPSSGLRKESLVTDGSPTSTTPSSLGIFSSGNPGSSREDSVTSGSMGEIEGQFDSIPVVISRKATDLGTSDLERSFGGLGISEGSPVSGEFAEKVITPRPITLTEQVSAPAELQTQPAPDVLANKPILDAAAVKRQLPELCRSDSAEVGDDEDEELGNAQVHARSHRKQEQPSSKLATQMLRTNSQGSVISSEETPTFPQFTSNPADTDSMDPIPEAALLVAPAKQVDAAAGSLTPPQIFPLEPGNETKEIDMDPDVDATPRPHLNAEHTEADIDPDPTPRRGHSPHKNNV